MSVHLRSICIVVPGLNRLNLVLQPWHYLTEVAIQLSRQGHLVTIISDVGPDALTDVDGIPVRTVSSVRSFFWWPNAGLRREIDKLLPDVILWSIGPTSFLHQSYQAWKSRIQVGIFSSPFHSAHEILRLGIFKLFVNYPLSLIHLLGTFSPRWLLRLRARSMGLRGYVAQTQTTASQLAKIIGNRSISAIFPGVDDAWSHSPVPASLVRARLGFTPRDFVVLYFGSPAPLRGLPVLIQAFAMISKQARNLKLLILNRRHAHELDHESAALETLIAAKGLRNAVRIETGFLNQQAVREMLHACDLVALPFELVSSDAPLSILEATAASKPVLTSRLGCLPELASTGMAFLAEPGDPVSVARALLAAKLKANGGRMSPSKMVRGWETVGEEWSDLIQSF